MNKISLSYVLAIIVILCISANSVCMEILNIQTEPMSPIERQLFLREITKRGIAIHNEIQQTSQITIEDVFYKTDKDQLTRNIFNTIEAKKNETRFTLLENYIGNEIRYYWIDDRDHSAVRIKAQLTNTKELENIIEIYKNSIEVSERYKDNDTDHPNLNTCFKFASAVCLIYYLYTIIP